MKGGAARAAQTVTEALEVVEPMIHEALRTDPTVTDMDRQNNEQFLANGQQLRQWLLDHVHKKARPELTPDLLTLARMQQAFMADVNDICRWALGEQ
jgi:hypothetical protein